MRLTENWIGVGANGEIAYVKVSPHPEATSNKKKLREIVSATTGQIIAAEAMVLTTLTDVFTWLRAFNALPVHSRSGYDQYFNSYGTTNPESPRGLDTEGAMRNAIIFLNVLHERKAKGGADGDEAGKALHLIAQFNAEVGKKIINAEKQDLLAKAAALFSTDEIQAEQVKLGLADAPPVATVTPDEADDVAVEVVNTELVPA